MPTEALVEALKRLLRQRNLTYAGLAGRLGLSEASVKRLFSQRSFTLRRIEQILGVLDVDFFELAKLARGAADTPGTLDTAQEAALAADPRLLGVFYLLYNDWQPAEIVRRYEITQAECLRLLGRLEKLRLIDWLPRERVKLRFARPLRLRDDGPIRARHGAAAVEQFIGVPFDQHGGHFRFEYRELSEASFAVIKRRIDRIAAEFNELAELDGTLPAGERRSIGVALAIRPWKLGFVTGLAERPRRRTVE